MPLLKNKFVAPKLGISRTIPHLCGMPRRLREKRRLMIFRTFVDESALDPSKDDALIMAGFVGELSEWERVSDAWDECLRHHPSVEYFKFKEATSLSGEFWKFDRSSADAKMVALAEVIARFRIQGICVTVPHASFANRDSKSAKGMMGSRAYDYGFFSLVFRVLRQIREHASMGSRVDFVFDRRPELRSCIENFNALKDADDLESPLLEDFQVAGECFPGDDKDILALQMADLLAGQSSSTLKDGVTAKALQIITDAKPLMHWVCHIPSLTPALLESQKISGELYASVMDLIRRAYGDKESGPTLNSDLKELTLEQEWHKAKVLQLIKSYERSGVKNPLTDNFLKTINAIRAKIYGKD